MQTRRSSSALAVTGEVSLSFQGELAATIHRAFEVALEIAVVEVSKLVSQALGDVREQMQETLRENTFLKTRLQCTEHELDTVRKAKRGKSSASAPDEHRTLQTKTGNQSTSTEDAEPSAQKTEDNGGDGCEEPGKSFCEIRVDGSVQSRDLSSASTTTQSHDVESGLSHDPLIPDQQQKTQHYQDTQADQNQSSTLINEQPVCKKEESPERQLGKSSGEDDSEEDNDIRPGCSFNPVPDEEFEPDRLSLVQSKLLEDWRPDPDAPQNRKTESVEANPNQILDTPDILLPAGGHPGFSATFDGLFHSVTKTHLVDPDPQNEDVNVRTNVHTRIHQCKLCGHSFSRASDLRRHHSHRHRARASNTGKSANTGRPIKQQLFPPGCSPYHCNECGRDFNRMENLKTHLRIHTGERPYSCTVCGVRFRHSGALTRHFRIHTGEKPYVCGQCGKRFRNCGGLRFHQKSHARDRHMVMNCT